MRKEVKTYGTLHLMGMELPIIGHPGEGWELVAHKNGPALANDHAMCTLGAAIKDEGLGIPLALVANAVEMLVGLEWHNVYEKALEGVAAEKVSDPSLLDRPQGRV